MQPPLYHLDVDHQESPGGALTGEGGIMGKKMTGGNAAGKEN